MASGAAKRYAQAVFSLAKERGTLAQWQDDLALLSSLVASPSVAAYMASPNVSTEDKQKYLDTGLASAQAETRNLARLLLQRHRLNEASDLFERYAEAYLAEQGIAIADVTTAETLDEAGQALVKAKLSQIVGKDVQLRLHTDPAIIGGLIARVGDQLIDGSVINQLRLLRARLATTA